MGCASRGNCARDGFRPSRTGSGACRRRTNLSTMDMNALLAPVFEFFNNGIGKLSADLLFALYAAFSPDTAEAAHIVEIPA
ncbi:hypothetical protein GCM10025785_16390 [Corynebacterium canis]